MDEGVWESRLEGRWGVARETLREARRRVLREGQEWHTVANRVVLTREGLDKMAVALGIPVEVADSGSKTAPSAENGTESDSEQEDGTVSGGTAEKALSGHLLVGDGPFTGAVAAQKEAAQLRVTRLVRNPRIVLATDGESVLRLRVRDSAKYRPGMMVSARQVQGDLWEALGRGPRWVGRW
jgi:hypothetical protein